MSAAPNKTRRTRKAAPAPVEVEPVAEVAVPAPALPNRVSLSDMWAMRLAQQEKRAALAEAEAEKYKRLYALKTLDPKGIVLGIESALDAAKKKAERAENAELIAKKRMEHTIGRSLANLAIDPDTGEIVDHK